MVVTELDEYVLANMPHFIAVNWQKLLEAQTPQEQVERAIHVYDLGLRILTISMVSQYLTRDKDRVRDSYMNELLLKKFPHITIDGWQQLFFAALRAYEGQRDLFFVPELYDFYWIVSSLPHQRREIEPAFDRLTQIASEVRNKRLLPENQAGWDRLAKETLDILKQIMSGLKFFGEYDLVRVIDCGESFYDFELNRGLRLSKERRSVPQDIKLGQGWFYLRKGTQDFLLLHPLLVFWEQERGNNDLLTADTGVYDRFIYERLQYFLAILGKTIKDDKDVRAFVTLLYDTIDDAKRRRQDTDRLNWWQLRDLCAGITHQRMSTVRNKYSRELYLQRDKTYQAFERFLESDKRCFVLTGKSGVGKSNFLLALNERLQSRADVCLLAYDGAQLRVQPLVTETICQDFNDRLNLAGEPIRQVWQQIARVEGIEERLVILCIDAINENPDAKELLKQLDELVQSPWPWLKVVFSSRPEMWQTIKHGVHLAEALYYREEGAEVLGVAMEPFSYSERIEPFSQQELPEAYAKYKQVFELRTEYEALSHGLREMLRDPLSIWLVAKTYAGTAIPETLKTTELIERYVNALVQSERLNKEDLRFLEKQLVPLMVREMRYANAITISDIDAADNGLYDAVYSEQMLSNGRRINESFTNLLDADILLKQEEGREQRISFKYERFYEYFAGLRLFELFDQIKDRYQLYSELVEETKKSPFLWGAIKSSLLRELRENPDPDVAISLSRSPNYFVRELISSALVDFGRDYPEKTREIVTALMSNSAVHSKVVFLQSAISLLKGIHRDRTQINGGKVTAVEVASHLTMKEVLVLAIQDPAQEIRVAAIQQVYHLLSINQIDLVFKILDDLFSKAFPRWRLPSFKAIEAYILLSLLILFNYFEDSSVIAKLQSKWQRIIGKGLFLNVRTKNGIIVKVQAKLRDLIVTTAITFIMGAIKQIEASGTAVVSLKDLEWSFSHSPEEIKRFKRIAHYIDTNQGSIIDIREDLLVMAASRNLLALYAVTVVFYARILSERDVALSLAREVFQVSLSQSPPTPILGGVALALEVILQTRIHTFDKTVYSLLDEMLGELQRVSQSLVTSHSRSYFWTNYNFCIYYRHLHMGQQDVSQLHPFIEWLLTNKMWSQVQNVIFFESQANLDFGFNQASVLEIFSLLKYPEPIVRTIATQALANLRSKYVVEIDELINELKIPVEAKVLIENHRVNQSLGMILTISSFRFWTKAILHKDYRLIGFLLWVADYVDGFHAFRPWLTGVIHKAIGLIYHDNESYSAPN